MAPDTIETASYSDRFEDWRYFDGVRSRRIFALFIDYAIVFMLLCVAAVLVFILGIATLGAGWLLYAILAPLVALSYIAWTLGGPKQATIGMQWMSVKLTRYDEQPIDWITAVVHAVLFWASAAIFMPLLLAPLFTHHKRMLHDIALGMVAVRSDVST